MVHDVRVIRMNAQHLPSHIRKWAGDSVGRWEGDTLVVDTTNFNADQIRYVVSVAPGRTLMMVESVGAEEQDRLNGPGKDLHVIERFTRVGGEGAALPLHDRGSGNLGTTMDGRVHLAGNRSAHLRVRVSRSELRSGEHSAGREAARRGGGETVGARFSIRRRSCG